VFATTLLPEKGGLDRALEAIGASLEKGARARLPQPRLHFPCWSLSGDKQVKKKIEKN